MASKVPKLRLNNDKVIPVFGLGTWKSEPGVVNQAVKDAIDIGYRHIDCAHIYGNEKEIGDALAVKIEEGVVNRKDLFITSKLWNTSHRPDLVEPALRETLENLGLEYLDLYLIHWPFAFKEGDDPHPKNADGLYEYSEVDYLDTWKAFEAVYEKGLVKSIGVSNFNSSQLKRLLGSAKIVPVVNQIECHPYLTQLKLSEFVKSQNILVTAYSPLGSPDRPWAKPDDPQLLDDVKLKELAEKYNKSPAQVLIRYQIDRGHVVIPKSVTKSRIAENFDVFDFKLSPEDIEYINSLDCNGRICPFVTAKTHRYWPFKIPY